MKLYIISQDENNGYDTYDSAVVCAENEEEARNIDPSGQNWRENWSEWCSSPNQVEVMYIGEAAPEVEKGVVLASYNAG